MLHSETIFPDILLGTFKPLKSSSPLWGPRNPPGF